jgi:glycerol kinase
VEALAASAGDMAGIYLVPAFTGLGAPYWDAQARGAILGLTRGAGRAEIARAGLESTVFQTRDLLDAMAADGAPIAALKVDGGMTANAWLLQRMADICAVDVMRPKVLETTAFGAAALAGLGAGIYSTTDDIAKLWAAEAAFAPALEESARARSIDGWRQAVARVRSERA